MMKEIMCQIIAHVTADATRISEYSCMPVVEDDTMGKGIERGREDKEQCRRHDEAVSVHR